MWCQAGEGTLLPSSKHPVLSPGRMSSPQGHPDGVLAGSERSVEHVGEVRGERRAAGWGGSSLEPSQAPVDPSFSVLLLLGCCPAPGRGLLQQCSCASQVPGTDRQEVAVHTRDSAGAKEGG